MKRFKQKSTYVSLAVSAFLAAGSAIAEIEEITVTANKREQSLQDVPLTVSVTSAETIEQSSIVDLQSSQSRGFCQHLWWYLSPAHRRRAWQSPL